MEVKRVFIDREPGQVIQIGLGEHVNPRMWAGGLFSQGVVEVMVARVDGEKVKLMVTAPDHFLILSASSFCIEE